MLLIVVLVVGSAVATGWGSLEVLEPYEYECRYMFFFDSIELATEALSQLAHRRARAAHDPLHLRRQGVEQP